ncbi:MAG: cyclic nucleotide-binding domain-containing protein [Spirochaetaceae bacterium]|jgi:CRP-like cAMP-binding protein|nr:cyclic nucleotide-binding domain-containing protein [Spirochaetaceae bacterium]
MPKLIYFKPEMTVYIEGDASENVYILQSGQVNLIYTDIETGNVRRDVLQQGEFFGVKSALGKYPREETANVIRDSTVIVFTVPEFEAVALKNPRIIIQMLKVYSGQLRKISRLMSALKFQSRIRRDNNNSAGKAGEHGAMPPDGGLYKIGIHYFYKTNFEEAKYVFGKYLQSYPNGSHAAEIKYRLSSMGDHV